MTFEVKKVSILGAGIMGSGIAQVAAQAGYEISMRDVQESLVERGLSSIKESLSRMQKGGKITQERVIEILSRVKGSTDFREAVSNADLVIEAIPEDLELKKQVFKELDETCPEHTILATNTSSLSVTAISSATKKPQKVMGMHFSNPVPVMMCVELIKGRDTSDETLEVAKDVVKKMGKDYFMALDFPGFASNRLLPLFANEAFYVVWEGIATPEDVDKMCKLMLRHPMGPFELADFSGLDTLLSVLEYLHKEIGEKYRPCPLLKQLVAAGHLGRKAGRGVYKYS